MISDEERGNIAANLCEIPCSVPMMPHAIRQVAELTWNAGADGDMEALEAIFPEVAETEAVLESSAVDAEGRPIAGCHCKACGAGAWADVDSLTPYCPMCGCHVRNWLAYR